MGTSKPGPPGSTPASRGASLRSYFISPPTSPPATPDSSPPHSPRGSPSRSGTPASPLPFRLVRLQLPQRQAMEGHEPVRLLSNAQTREQQTDAQRRSRRRLPAHRDRCPSHLLPSLV
jgi:hypothetical protein